MFIESMCVCVCCVMQTPGLNVVTEMVIGYRYPGKPLANVAFKTYGYISMTQALFLLQDLKLGHYMKIPPRSMFIAQVTKCSTTYFIFFFFCGTHADALHKCQLQHVCMK